MRFTKYVSDRFGLVGTKEASWVQIARITTPGNSSLIERKEELKGATALYERYWA